MMLFCLAWREEGRDGKIHKIKNQGIRIARRDLTDVVLAHIVLVEGRRMISEGTSTVEELSGIAALLSDYPKLFRALLACICRSHRLCKACREYEPTNDELRALRSIHGGERVIGASRRGSAWLRNEIDGISPRRTIVRSSEPL